MYNRCIYCIISNVAVFGILLFFLQKSRLSCRALEREEQVVSLEKPLDLDPCFDDLTRAKSAKELKEHLETRVL